MNQANVLEILTKLKPILMQQFGVVRLALFGSTARDEASENSDVDILIYFEGIATSERYFGVQCYLEDSLGCEVDLVTDKALRPQCHLFVERDMIYV